MLVLLPAFVLHTFSLGLSRQATPTKIEIFRGQSLPGLSLPDQDVEDTVLDSEEADAPHGGFYTLETGPTKTVLIRFGQLKRYLAHTGGVAEAELVLSPGSDAKPVLKSVGRLLKRWGQGPALKLSDLMKPAAEDTPTTATPATPAQATAAKGAPGTTLLRTDTVAATWGAATWHESRFGVSGAHWQTNGARGTEDAEPIPGATLKLTDEGAVITGLGPAVEAMAKGENDGFALVFDSNGSFYSSSNTYGKPILRIVTKPAPATQPSSNLEVSSILENNGVHATVINKGTGPAPAFTTRWSIDGTPGIAIESPAGLAPGQSRTFDYSVPPHLDDKDHRKGALTFVIHPEGEDQDWTNKELTFFPKGIPVYFEPAPGKAEQIKQDVQLINELVLPRSRYAAAPDGCFERIRVVDQPTPDAITIPSTQNSLPQILLAMGAADLSKCNLTSSQAPGFFGQIISRFPDITGGGDTRFDAGLLPSTSFAQANFFSPLELTTPADPTGLLSPNSTFALNAAIGQVGAARKTTLAAAYALKPGAAIALRASDETGRPLSAQALNLYKPGSQKPDLTLTTGDDGVVLLPSGFNLGVNELYTIGASKFGITEWDALRGWQINAAGQRGAKVAFIDLRYALPTLQPDYNLNLATGRALTDSANSLPATLAPLLDGKGATDVPLPTTDDGYIEIDLNRDRTITEIRLKASIPWDKFDILVYNTGQKPTEAVLWAREQDFQISAKTRGKKDPNGVSYTVPYRGLASQVRFIRIVNKSTTISKEAPSKPSLEQWEIFGQPASQ